MTNTPSIELNQSQRENYLLPAVPIMIDLMEAYLREPSFSIANLYRHTVNVQKQNRKRRHYERRMARIRAGRRKMASHGNLY